MSFCSKPGCGGVGAAVLGYDYSQRLATLEDPEAHELSPHLYVLCGGCAEKLTPPRGWTVDDLRAKPPLFFEREPSITVLEIDPPASRQQESARREQLFFGTSA
ncbi:MAG: DUF3499 family protein [Actinobacteria bacterium]|nr:DUF3499 family protein [Actinomycetota bacterium]